MRASLSKLDHDRTFLPPLAMWITSAQHFPDVYPSDTLEPMKDVGLRIRIDRDLREQFVKACQADDKPASQVIREFMREYVRQHPPQQGATENKKEEQNGH
jgi:hypothetical protein